MDFKTCTRAEWDAHQEERRRATHEWGFDPGMPWHVAKWHERIRIAMFYGFMWGVVFPAMFGGLLFVLGMMADGITTYNVEHDRCLKHATNGYEIRQCH